MTLPSVPGTHGHLTSKRPTAARSDDGLTIMDFAQVDNWSDFLRVLSKDRVLLARVVRAIQSGDPRLLAYSAMRLHDAMGVAFQVTLDDGASEDLAEELDAARVEQSCTWCGQNPVHPEHDGLCGSCNDALVKAGR